MHVHVVLTPTYALQMHVRGAALACLGNLLSAHNGLEGRLNHDGVAAVNVLEVARRQVDARGNPLRDVFADLGLVRSDHHGHDLDPRLDRPLELLNAHRTLEVARPLVFAARDDREHASRVRSGSGF